GRRETARHQCAAWRRDQHRGQKRGDGIGYSGHKHQKGEKVIAIIDNNGYVLAPLPVAPVHKADTILLPEGLKGLKRVAKRGRKRFFNQAIHALRERVERTFAWEDKFKRLLLRFEHIQLRHYGMKLMAYTLINLRRFCAT